MSIIIITKMKTKMERFEAAMALSDLVIYLRYFTLKPTRSTPLHYKYAQIATMTNLPQTKVQQLCLAALPGNQKRYGLKKRSSKYNLTAE